MRLLSAATTNFRLLRSIELEFSTDRERALTVIRAENKSGKTSTLKALKWALFGTKEGLDSQTERLSPIDWPENTPCEVVVRVDFEHTLPVAISADAVSEDTQRYTLRRTVVERPTGQTFMRGQDRVELFQHLPAGAEAIPGAETRLREILPVDMKNIFFTDGDAALSFISADSGRTTKIDQVKNAIRSLLGLGLLEDVENALKNARGRLLRKQREDSPTEELATVTQQLQDKEAERDTLAQDLATAKTRAQELEHRLAEAEKDYERVLALGNYEELAAQRERTRQSLDRYGRQAESLVDEHTALLKSKQLSWGVLGGQLVAGLSVLKQLYDQGLIPKTSIPVLRDRLERGRCICGAALSPGSDARHQVEQLIEYEKGADDHSKLLTLLYNTGDADHDDSRTAPNFLKLCNDLRLRRGEALKELESANREFKELEEKLAEINEADIEAQRMNRNSAKTALEQSRRRVTELEMRLQTLEPEIKELDAKQTTLRRHNSRLHTLNAQLEAIEDLLAIVSATLVDMQNVYLRHVSTRMNTLFLDMIGADPAGGSVYQSAEITPEYEIVVNSLDGRRLNPDHEVNGASQRALTFSFIWALTEVSGVAAPRVIDTPLGMMAGAVKRRVLELIAAPPTDSTLSQRADHQVALFLTQSEIADTEDILDRRAGSSITFSNSEDYPRDLVSRPTVDRPTVFTCKCSHREYCDRCERKSRGHYPLTRVAT